MKVAVGVSGFSEEVACWTEASSDLQRTLLLVWNRLRPPFRENWQPLLVCDWSSQQGYSAFSLLGPFILGTTCNTLVAIVCIVETKNYRREMLPWCLLVRHWMVAFLLIHWETLTDCCLLCWPVLSYFLLLTSFLSIFCSFSSSYSPL